MATLVSSFSDIPISLLPNAQPGMGVAAFTMQPMASYLTVDPAARPAPEAKINRQSYRMVSDEQSLSTFVEASLAVSAQFPGASLKASSSFAKGMEVSTRCITLVAVYETVSATATRVPFVIPTTPPPPDFRQQFGDYCVESLRFGSRLVVKCKCRSNDQSSLQKFESALGGSYNVVTAEAKAKFKQASSESHVSLEITADFEGVTGEVPVVHSLDDIEPAFEFYKKNQAPVPMYFNLAHYHCHDPRIPITVPVPPSAVVECNYLFRRVLHYVYLKNNLPASWAPALQADATRRVDRFSDELCANASNLLTDDGLRRHVMDSEKELDKWFDEMRARETFLIQAITNEGQCSGEEDPSHVEWTNGAHSPTAVYWAQALHLDWVIGWAKGNITFNLPGSLVVMWKAIARRHDGYGGTFRKVSGGINQSSVSIEVTSCYDRGTDWELQVWYVTREAYPFSAPTRRMPPPPDGGAVALEVQGASTRAIGGGAGRPIADGGDGRPWTLMVYGCADNDLFPFWRQNRQQIEHALAAVPNVQCFLYADVPPGHPDELGYFEWKTQADRAGFVKVADTLEAPIRMRTIHSSSPDTCLNFIRDVKSRTPDTRHMLVLWNHGGGFVFGVEDNPLGVFGPQMMDYTALTKVAQGLGKAGGVDVLLWDACLMSTLAILGLMEHHEAARFMVASPNPVPGAGCNYETMIRALTDRPTRFVAQTMLNTYSNTVCRAACDLTQGGFQKAAALWLEFLQNPGDAFTNIPEAQLDWCHDANDGFLDPVYINSVVADKMFGLVGAGPIVKVAHGTGPCKYGISVAVDERIQEALYLATLKDVRAFVRVKKEEYAMVVVNAGPVLDVAPPRPIDRSIAPAFNHIGAMLAVANKTLEMKFNCRSYGHGDNSIYYATISGVAAPTDDLTPGTFAPRAPICLADFVTEENPMTRVELDHGTLIQKNDAMNRYAHGVITRLEEADQVVVFGYLYSDKTGIHKIHGGCGGEHDGALYTRKDGIWTVDLMKFGGSREPLPTRAIVRPAKALTEVRGEVATIPAPTPDGRHLEVKIRDVTACLKLISTRAVTLGYNIQPVPDPSTRADIPLEKYTRLDSAKAVRVFAGRTIGLFTESAEVVANGWLKPGSQALWISDGARVYFKMPGPDVPVSAAKPVPADEGAQWLMLSIAEFPETDVHEAGAPTPAGGNPPQVVEARA